MSKFNKAKTVTTKFYKEQPIVEEVYSGFLHKSPNQSSLSIGISSWKKRFFVLSKTGEDAYQLAYYTNSEKRDKPVGEIDLSKISLMFTGPEKHQMWDWIQKHFKCPPSSVLFLRVEDDTPKHARDYFLIGENSDDVDGWHNALVNALKTQKSNKRRHTVDTLEDNRLRSMSAPEKAPELKPEDQYEERWSAPELMLSSLPPDHYAYPRKFSEPPVPVERKISVAEDEHEKDGEQDGDEKDGEQDESPEDSSEYMLMASLKMALEDHRQEEGTACIQTNTSINGHQSSLCNGIVKQDKDDKNKCETHTHVEKEICVSQNSLKNSLILTQEEGKPCVSQCRQIQDSRLFHKGDQILAFNGLMIDTVEEIHAYLRRLSKDEVKLTIRRLTGSQPLLSEPCTSR